MIQTADILYLADEPASFASGAVAQLQQAGMCINAIPMRQQTAEVVNQLYASEADCVLLISPFQYHDFINEAAPALQKLRKPVISWLSEYTFVNIFTGYRDFEDSAESYADFYVCSQDSDMEALALRGKPAVTMPNWVATDIFTPGPPLAERIQKACFVGHTQDYVTGMYAERRRVLAELADLVDVLQIPRAAATAPLVAQAFRNYACVLCPPSNGRAHSIRVYEAAAAGALVVEVGQPLDAGNIFFNDAEHCLRLAPGIHGEVLRAWFQGQKWENHQNTASRAMWLCRQEFAPEAVFRRIAAAADKLPKKT